MDVDSFAPRLSFFFGISMNFYMVPLALYAGMGSRMTVPSL